MPRQNPSKRGHGILESLKVDLAKPEELPELARLQKVLTSKLC